MKDNIVLIGMPGCGKSTIGVVLAKAIGYIFIDSDLLIQSQEQRVLSEIIREEGLDGFLRIEEEVNAGIQSFRTVIATGGSVVYGKRAMDHLRQTGTVIYLRLPLKEVDARLGDLSERGVALREGQTLADLYKERIPMYEAYADIILDIQGLSIREAVTRIKESIREAGTGRDGTRGPA